MSIDQSARAGTGQGRSTTIVTALVDHGLLADRDRAQALVVVHRALEAQAPATAPLKRRFAELAGYVGGAFIVSAAAILSASRWSTLGEGQQVALLGGVAVLLAARASPRSAPARTRCGDGGPACCSSAPRPRQPEPSASS